ncbi:hypothetical protein IJ118_00500 [Candidatus Saccharibacteria bacterium]|nr:hypothetical protein [Candidatus Saccharibacteria bacterium]
MADGDTGESVYEKIAASERARRILEEKQRGGEASGGEVSAGVRADDQVATDVRATGMAAEGANGGAIEGANGGVTGGANGGVIGGAVAKDGRTTLVSNDGRERGLSRLMFWRNLRRRQNMSGVNLVDDNDRRRQRDAAERRAKEEKQRMAAERASRGRLSKAQKIWIGASCGVVVVLVIVGVVIGVNNGGTSTGCNSNGGGGESVTLDLHPEGYGDNPSPSVIAAVFSQAVNDKYLADEGYTYEDAVSDYESAFVKSDFDLRKEVALAYATFVYNVGKDATGALRILDETAAILTNQADILRYYTMMINICDQTGFMEQASEYRITLNELVQTQAVPIDEALLGNGGTE